MMRLMICLSLCLGALACAPERPADLVRERRQVGGSGDELKQQVAAIVNGETITLETFERRLEAMPEVARMKYVSPASRAELLDALVLSELMADEAERRGYGDDPAVIQAMNETMVRLMLHDELRQRAPISAITDAEIERAWREDNATRTRPERRRAAIIYQSSREALEAAVATLPPEPAAPDDSAALQERINAFRRAAATRSIEPALARDGGDLGELEPPDVTRRHVEIAAELYKLERVGAMTPPFEVRGRWAIVMMIGRQAPSQQPLALAAPALRERLYTQRRQAARDAFIQELRSGATLETFPDVLAQAKPPERAPALSPALLNPALVPVRDLSQPPRAADAASADPTERP